MPTNRDIGPFEVLEKLGAGGMGVVFQARDRRLNRLVALKLLPEASSDAARERFQREALAIAALNHPNICTLYEAGEHAGQPYLVMELLEGETLHDRLRRGPVPLPQLVQWGAEIADALQAAHAKGILHRDLKPGNIFITQRGSAKVLDFGLAQFALAGAAEADAATLAGTAPGAAAGKQPLTTPGATLGTAAYMSPEQARGELLDARSDLFSLGVVLYEMAGGQPPFQGRTSADLSAAILMRIPPPPSSLRPEIPPRLDDIIAQCLEKDPDLRFQSAAELRVGLRRLLGTSSSGAPSSSPNVLSTPGLPPPSTPAPASATAVAPAPRPRWALPAAAFVVLALAALAWWRWQPRPAPPPAAAANLSFRPLTFSGQVQDAAISPDGKFLAHVDASPQGTSLHLLSVANGSDVEIMPPAPGCCQSPSFSPDGSTVYFVEDKTLKAIPVLGGAVRTIANEVCSGAGVSPDGKQIAYLAARPAGDELTVALADGSQAHVRSDPSPSGYDSRCWINGPLYPDTPAWSPDGRWIAVERSGAGTDVTDHVVLVGAADGRLQELGPDLPRSASDLAWRPDGRGVLVTDSIPSTSPSQIREIAYPGGQLLQLTHDLQGFDRVTIASQAGGAIALVHSNPQYSVWRQAIPGGAFEPLPGGGADQDGFFGLAWTPQGQLVSVRFPAGQSQLWLEGAGPPQPIPVGNLPTFFMDPNVSPSGQIVFQGLNPAGTWNIWRVDLQGTGLANLTPGLNAINPVLVEGGKSVAFLNMYAAGNASHQRLWIVPLAGGAPRKTSPIELYTNFGLPLPDPERVLAPAMVPNSSVGDVVEISLNGAAPIVVKPRESRGSFAAPYATTPDGRALAGVITDGNTGNIWAAPLDGGPLYAITHFTDLTIAAYAFSRDGRLAVSRGSQNSDAVVATGLAPAGHR
ncbi:MAG TPA: protein kinase [Terriglobales bacterium]|nr:protein kinase [Terriglobales bacterium]